jgi:hypothetical protein
MITRFHNKVRSFRSFGRSREFNSAAVGHERDLSEFPAIHGQCAAVMGGVLDHSPHHVAHRLAGHDRPG